MPTVTYTWSNSVASYFANDLVTAGMQDGPAIAAINGGASYFGAWNDLGAVEGRLLASDGSDSTDEFLVNSTVINDQVDPSISQLTGGNIVVSFTDYSADAGGDIRARLFTSSGSAVGLDFGVNTGTNDDTDSDVAALANGGFVVTWTRDFGSGDRDVDGAIFDSTGAIVTNFYVDTAFDSASNAQVVGLANGNFVVVWEKEPAAGGDSVTYFRIYNSAGTALTNATIIDNLGSINEDIQITALQDGGFAVAYTDNGWGLDGTEITALIYNANGSVRAGFLRPNIATAGSQNGASITTLSNGYIVVGWNNGGTLTYQAYDPSGSAIGSNYSPIDSIVDAEIAGLSGGLIANVRSSTAADAGGDQSIRTSVDELTRTIVGDGTSEVLTGDSLRDTISGGLGNDTLNGAGGDDVLSGNEGADTLNGGDGNDTLVGGAGIDTMNGGNGSDTYFVDNANDQVTDNALSGFDVVGSTVSYHITGRIEELVLQGSANINATGNNIDNYLFGNAGNNILNGGSGNDYMQGGAGDDAYIVKAAGDSVVEFAAEGTDTVKSTIDYTLTANVEKLFLMTSASIDGTGNDLNNAIYGNAGANIISGYDGADKLFGYDGVDQLLGGSGNDDLQGGDGNDWIEGGFGFDRVYGNGGADKFVFGSWDFSGATTATCDQIRDFSHAESDKIKLDLVDANTLLAGDQAFTFIGTAGFTGSAGQLRYFETSSNTYVEGDTNGDGVADFMIRVDGLHALVGSDFIL